MTQLVNMDKEVVVRNFRTTSQHNAMENSKKRELKKNTC